MLYVIIIAFFFYRAPYGYALWLAFAQYLLIVLIIHIPLVIGLVKGFRIAYATQLAAIYILPIVLLYDIIYFQKHGIESSLSILIPGLSILGFGPFGVLYGIFLGLTAASLSSSTLIQNSFY